MHKNANKNETTRFFSIDKDVEVFSLFSILYHNLVFVYNSLMGKNINNHTDRFMSRSPTIFALTVLLLGFGQFSTFSVSIFIQKSEAYYDKTAPHTTVHFVTQTRVQILLHWGGEFVFRLRNANTWFRRKFTFYISISCVCEYL